MKKHIGSTISIVLGILLFASVSTNPNGLVTGSIIILGALAYRSAKKRKLGDVNTTLLRKGLEISALIIIAAAVLLQNDLKTLIASDPVPNFIIPLWAIVAYAVISLKTKDITQKQLRNIRQKNTDCLMFWMPAYYRLLKWQVWGNLNPCPNDVSGSLC